MVQTIQKPNIMVAVMFLDHLKTLFKNLSFEALGIQGPLMVVWKVIIFQIFVLGYRSRWEEHASWRASLRKDFQHHQTVQAQLLKARRTIPGEMPLAFYASDFCYKSVFTDFANNN